MKKLDIYYLHFVKAIPDKLFLKIHFRISSGKRLNLKNPRTFNEKIQWLKLYDRNPLYHTIVDKCEAKKYAAGLIGWEHIIPNLGIYDRFEEIDFDRLPEQFVLKCTHDSGSIVICSDRSTFDREAAKAIILAGLKRDYYYVGREWAYKEVPPRILAEQYMVDESGSELKDYKVFCFNGEPKIIQVDYNRFSGHRRNLYSCSWEYIPGTSMYPTDPKIQIEKPAALNTMLELAKKLSHGIPHVRVDFYVIHEQVFFGEMTLYHGSGFEKYHPESLNLQLGSYLQLPGRGESFVSNRSRVS